MKIFLFSAQWPEYLIELANAMSRLNHEVVLMLPTNHRFTSDHFNLIEPSVCLETYEVVTYKSLRDNLRMLWGILKAVRKHRPDILHIQANGHPLFFLLFPFLPTKTRIVNTIHDPVLHLGDARSAAIKYDAAIFFTRFFCRAYIVHGEVLRKMLHDSYRVPLDNIYSNFHGHFGIYKKFQKKSLEENPKQLLFFGRIWEYKGLIFYIRSCNILIQRIPDLTCYIVGAGEDISKYLNEIKHPENFRIVNERVTIQDAGAYFESSAVVVLPYVDASQSGVVPVAYAYGKPVVASRVGALPEVVVDGHTGFLVSPKSIDQLVDKIEYLLVNPTIRQTMGKNAFDFAQSVLNWDKIARRTEDIYRLA